MIKLDYSHYLEKDSAVFGRYCSVIAERLYAGLMAETDLDDVAFDQAQDVPARRAQIVDSEVAGPQTHHKYRASKRRMPVRKSTVAACEV